MGNIIKRSPTIKSPGNSKVKSLRSNITPAKNSSREIKTLSGQKSLSKSKKNKMVVKDKMDKMVKENKISKIIDYF